MLLMKVRGLPARPLLLHACAAVLLLSGLAVSARAQEAIPVGMSLPLTGPLANYGADIKTGAAAYIETVNRAGGIGGRKIVITTLEDHYNPPETVKNLRELNGQGTLAMLGLYGFPVVSASLPVLDELKLPAIGLTSGGANVRKPGQRYAFPVRASFADETAAVVDHLKTLDFRRVAIVRQDNPFGNVVADTMVTALARLNLKPVLDLTIKVDGSNVKDIVAKLAAAEPVNMIYLSMLSPGAVSLLSSLRDGKVQVGAEIFANSAVDSVVLTKGLHDKARGVALTQIMPLMERGAPLVKNYLRDLKAIDPNRTPSFYGLEGYVEAKILVEGLRRCGAKINRENLVNALDTLGDYDVGGMVVTYAPGKREGSHFVDITMISQQGMLVH